jgi:hypothetical protein
MNYFKVHIWSGSDFNIFLECSAMKMQDIRAIAKNNGVRPGKLSKIEIIRSIQKTEGNNDCFATAYVSECNQMSCLWREDCMKAV